MKKGKIKSILTSRILIAIVMGVIGFSLGVASSTKTPEVAKDNSSEQVTAEVAKEDNTAEQEEIELSAGIYVAGEDFKEGKYDIVAISGGGNVMSTSQINAIMGKDKDNDMYVEEYKNATFKWASQVKITNNLKVKFIPVKE